MPADLTRDNIARAIALPGWEWMNGMLLHYGDSGLRIDRHRLGGYDDDPQRPIEGSPWLPDPSDPATAGCLLDLLGPYAHFVRFVRDRGWHWWDGTDWHDAPNFGTACFRAALARGRWG